MEFVVEKNVISSNCDRTLLPMIFYFSNHARRSICVWSKSHVCVESCFLILGGSQVSRMRVRKTLYMEWASEWQILIPPSILHSHDDNKFDSCDMHPSSRSAKQVQNNVFQRRRATSFPISPLLAPPICIFISGHGLAALSISSLQRVPRRGTLRACAQQSIRLMITFLLHGGTFIANM